MRLSDEDYSLAVAGAREKVEDALKKIEAAQRLLGDACGDLSAIVGAAPHWSRVGKLYDRTKDAWHKLNRDYAARHAEGKKPFLLDRMHLDALKAKLP